MTELRRILIAYLETLATRVYYRRAPEKAVFPYIVVEFLPSINDGEWDSVIPVDIDGWDRPVAGDTTILETIMDTIQLGLNKKSILTSNIGVTFYLESRRPVMDDDKQIERRKLSFEARLIERSL